MEHACADGQRLIANRHSEFGWHVCNAVWHERRLRQGAEFYQPDPVCVVRQHVRHEAQGQPGLAHATSTDQSEQSCAPEEPAQLGDFVFSPHEAAKRRGKRRPRPVKARDAPVSIGRGAASGGGLQRGLLVRVESQPGGESTNAELRGAASVLAAKRAEHAPVPTARYEQLIRARNPRN